LCACSRKGKERPLKKAEMWVARREDRRRLGAVHDSDQVSWRTASNKGVAIPKNSHPRQPNALTHDDLSPPSALICGNSRYVCTPTRKPAGFGDGATVVPMKANSHRIPSRSLGLRHSICTVCMYVLYIRLRKHGLIDDGVKGVSAAGERTCQPAVRQRRHSMRKQSSATHESIRPFSMPIGSVGISAAFALSLQIPFENVAIQLIMRSLARGNMNA
jgi:hypothetical protein